MRKIYNQNRIDEAISSLMYADILRGLDIPLFLIEYQVRENISNNDYFQIVIKGNLSISFVRDDGSTYSLSTGGENYVIGEMGLFMEEDRSVIAEATSPLLTIAIDTKTYKDKLLSNNAFLNYISTILANKIIAITHTDAASSSLSERVINYMRFKCDNQVLHGIEKAAFTLHCSPRQLQRILNQFENDGLVKKIGKGKYVLIKT